MFDCPSHVVLFRLRLFQCILQVHMTATTQAMTATTQAMTTTTQVTTTTTQVVTDVSHRIIHPSRCTLYTQLGL